MTLSIKPFKMLDNIRVCERSQMALKYNIGLDSSSLPAWSAMPLMWRLLLLSLTPRPE
jgi:hypothetical protein